MSDPVAVCIAQRLAKDIAFLAHQGVVTPEEARSMRAQLDPLVGTEFAQPFASAPPVHPGPHPVAAYAPALVPTPRAPAEDGSQTPLGAGVPVSAAASPAQSRVVPPAPCQDQPEPGVAPQAEEELATALYDYKPTADDELGFAKGDTIVVAAHTTEDWYSGHVQGRLGPDKLFPANYVEIRSSASEKKSLAGPSSSYAPQGYAPQGYAPQGYAPQGYAQQGHPPQGYPAAQAYPPAQAGQYETAGTGGESSTKGKWDKFRKSNVGQAATTGAAFGVGMGIASAIF